MDLKLRGLVAVAGILPLACGCSVLREVPRDQLAARPERRNLRVTDADGQRLDLRWARFGNDSLRGELRGGQGAAVAVELPLERVARLEQRQVDWFRTALVAGAGVAAGVFYLLQDDDETPPAAPRGKGGGPP